MLGRRLKLWAGRMALARRLERALPPAALALMGALADAGHEVGLVGGCVRDLLLDVAPRDWDIVTSAGPEAILAMFPEGRLMGAARGGNTVLIPREGAAYEVTPYRAPDLLGDLGRRDFTINAMALGMDVTLHDPLGGQADLARGVVRACLDPGERLREDPLRMLRAVRLAAQLDFALDPALEEAITSLAPLLDTVAPERVGAEFARLLVTDRPAAGLEQLRALGLLERFAPELLAGVGMAQNQYHAYPVWEHCLMALALVPPELHLRLAALLHDIGKPRSLSTDEQGNRHFYRHELIGAEMASVLLERLRFENETRRRVVHLVRYHMDLHMDGPVSDSAIRRMIGRIGLEHMHDLIQVRRADRLASGKREGDLSPETVYLLQQVERVLAEDAALKVTDLAVTGEDVLAVFGRPPGPYVGQVLGQLLDEVLEEPGRNTREHLLVRLAELSQL
ncbi:MAG: putative nucleotidyltransferase [Firmicutes bacterium]|nr:putative nucleotidyltransferase [Bacillota bacterium]